MEKTPTPHYPHADKWLLASCLQKATRRGLPSIASNCTSDLAILAPGYVRKRLGIIALEDIGTGNPRAVMDYILGLDITAGLSALCAGLKSRDACDLFWIMETDPELEKLRFEVGWRELSSQQEIAGCTTRPLWERLLALHAMTHEEAVLTLARMGLPPDQVEVLRKAKKMGLANLELAYGLLLVEAQGQTPTVKEAALLPAPLINGIPAYAYDMYTRTGKEAIRRWRASIPQLAALRLNQVYALLYLVETEVLDRLACYDFSSVIAQKVMELHFPQGNASDLIALAQESLPRLHDIRQEVAHGYFR